MAFVNISLLLGGLLVGVPIVLHLLLRQKPRPLEFPALRFVQQRRVSNQRTLRLRHWLLLLLRCLAVVVLAAALARPSVTSAALGGWVVFGATAALALLMSVLAAASFAYAKERWLTGALAALAAVLVAAAAILAVRALISEAPTAVGNRRAPVAAVLAFDTSPRMTYVEANRTRLEEAQDLASWLLDELPPDSEVAVAQSQSGARQFSLDLAAALAQVQRLETTGAPRRLTEVVADAIRLAGESPLKQKEVYVFTDLTRVAWSDADDGNLTRLLAENPDLLLYVVDVGVEQPRNFALAPLRLSEERLAAGSELVVGTTLTSLDDEGTRTVALYLEEPDPSRPVLVDGVAQLPQSRQRGREVRTVARNAAADVAFSLRGLPVGTHQGRVVIEGEDGLAADDARYFAIEVDDAWPVLVVAPSQVNTRNFVEALAPSDLRTAGQARFACRVARPSELANPGWEDARVVCLLDPPPMPPSAWEALAKFVEQGGGLAVFLGYEASKGDFLADASARQLLPGPLGRQWRAPDRDLFLSPRSYDHPILAEFRPIASQVPWGQFPVMRHWSFRELKPEARVALHFGNGQAAVVESTFGAGRVLTMTTPISEKARPEGRLPWNELTGPNDWPRFVLINEIVRYLVDTEGTRLNYTAGERVRLPNSSERYPQRYQLFAPPDAVQRVVARDEQVEVRSTEFPGAYRLKGNLGGVVVRGFAVNLPTDVSRLERGDREMLDRALGEDRYQLAREKQEIEVGVGTAREGHEFFPTLLILLAVILIVEQLLANRFYRRTADDPGGRS